MNFSAQHRGGAGEPLVLLHGFTDTWRTWELVLPALQERHDVLAVTLAGHAGGPEIDGELSDDTLAVAVERAMDAAGFATAHLVGNSLGGYTALRLAARGRARTVVALAPAGGWAQGDDSYRDTLQHFATTHELVKAAVPHAEAIAASPEGRRRATAPAWTTLRSARQESQKVSLTRSRSKKSMHCSRETITYMPRRLRQKWRACFLTQLPER